VLNQIQLRLPYTLLVFQHKLILLFCALAIFTTIRLVGLQQITH